MAIDILVFTARGKMKDTLMAMGISDVISKP